MNDPNGCLPNSNTGYRYNNIAFKLNVCRNVFHLPNCDCDPEITRVENDYKIYCNPFGSGLVNCSNNSQQSIAVSSQTSGTTSTTSLTTSTILSFSTRSASYQYVPSITSSSSTFITQTVSQSSLSPNVVTIYITNGVTVVATTFLPENSNSSGSKDTTILIIAIVSSIIIAALVTLLLIRRRRQFRKDSKSKIILNNDTEIVSATLSNNNDPFDEGAYNSSTTNILSTAYSISRHGSMRSSTPTNRDFRSNSVFTRSSSEQGFVDRAGPSLPPFPIPQLSHQHQQEVDLTSEIRPGSSQTGGGIYGMLNRPIEKGIPLHPLQRSESSTISQQPRQQTHQYRPSEVPPSYHDIVSDDATEKNEKNG
ncbi:hypothetical protein HK098_005276 [Nowakowskiella sp. JEL0407]|nr:hypothetical protein HK098_005276 [Nowakowskiella sp. JEL0407]